MKLPPEAGTKIPGLPETGVVMPGTGPVKGNISVGNAAKEGCDDTSSGAPSTGWLKILPSALWLGVWSKILPSALCVGPLL
jgi:hypothetical protein